MEGVKNGGADGSPFDIINAFFGGGGKQKQQGMKKAKPRLKELHISLEDVFKGKLEKIDIIRKRCCETCEGKGGKNVKTCPTCKGRKQIEKLVMLGPGAYTHTVQPCGECQGQGQIVDEKDKCKSCKGQKLVDNKKILEVAVEPGVPHEKDYIFTGESDEIPGVLAGDIYVRILIEKHPVFTRKGADL